MACKKRIVRWSNSNRPSHEKCTIYTEYCCHDRINIAERPGRKICNSSDRDKPISCCSTVANVPYKVLGHHDTFTPLGLIITLAYYSKGYGENREKCNLQQFVEKNTKSEESKHRAREIEVKKYSKYKI